MTPIIAKENSIEINVPLFFSVSVVTEVSCFFSLLTSVTKTATGSSLYLKGPVSSYY
ncbi:hypothetical protein PDIG_40940 [Penicillium digitatum PHI26]|uniref:Uncharacterized protein n=2 Tax=Penicillium digitatum TaxID=36651 RepID=K9FUL5_PEND2|nr:hypothetical protein PDIP_85860 [Penicillium digitatum Pd1]EKV04792.1 hypothetical protein PDIP_85860 [Penicillium digitatum Pd1]EKV12824.1 hypothetical protein PDIG_40940 [Penicillium digitatum PHI26]